MSAKDAIPSCKRIVERIDRPEARTILQPKLVVAREGTIRIVNNLDRGIMSAHPLVLQEVVLRAICHVRYNE